MRNKGLPFKFRGRNGDTYADAAATALRASLFTHNLSDRGAA